MLFYFLEVAMSFIEHNWQDNVETRVATVSEMHVVL